ncbi:hypothetical protein [Streptomyces sp. NPDC007070]|uniref:sodium:solute symporter family transporter n=1 Tax=Streptomyces sp. NPDC007070 TaxID=3154312 RepID=UPI0033E5D8C6
MHGLDCAAVGGYFVVMLLIGVWSHRRVRDVSDCFTGGGRMPWWLTGVSHHMSGYSAAVFVACAAVAYTYGITVYVWAFLPLALGTGLGTWLFAPRWNRLRRRYRVASRWSTWRAATTSPPSRRSPGAAPCSRCSTLPPNGPPSPCCSRSSPVCRWRTASC